MNHKAIALLSGGLDSTLAVLMMLRQDIKVIAITFLNHFGCDITDKSSCSKDPTSLAHRFGFELKLSHLGEKFIEIVKNPRHGHGKNMNPCIDCRILMLKEAREMMEITGADFVITGEVLGQRPMSQRKDTLNLIARKSGLKDLLLRPLSAKLLSVTYPETKKIVDREKLYAINGRSRKAQMALAKEFGLHDYPNSAAGCLLTDPIYSRRLKDLLKYRPDPDFNDLNLLKIGRHFRMSETCKIIVGRDEKENFKIKRMKGNGDYLLDVKGAGSPLVLLKGENAERFIDIGASLCARYSDLKNSTTVSVTVTGGNGEGLIRTKPAEQEIIEKFRIN